jgi:CubicO group peptidase (beta-lactamase class C family)
MMGFAGLLFRRILEESIAAEELTKVHAMEQTVASDVSLSESFRRTEQLAHRLVDWSEMRIWRTQSGGLRLVYRSDEGVIDPPRAPGPQGARLRRLALETGEPAVVSDTRTDARVEHQVRATSTTVYRVGSVTKMFTAAAVLQLAEEGRLALTDPVSRHLPEYPSGARVTVGQLLSHCSGVPDYMSLGERVMRQLPASLTREELFALFKDLPLAFAPGTRFSYSNSNHQLLGMILERVS